LFAADALWQQSPSLGQSSGKFKFTSPQKCCTWCSTSHTHVQKRERLSVEMKLLGPFGNSKQGHCPTHALNCCPESCWHKVNAQCWPCSFTVAPLHTPRPAVGTSVSNICCSTTSLSKSHLLKSKCSTTHKPSAVVVFLLALRC